MVLSEILAHPVSLVLPEPLGLWDLVDDKETPESLDQLDFLVPLVALVPLATQEPQVLLFITSSIARSAKRRYLSYS